MSENTLFDESYTRLFGADVGLHEAADTCQQRAETGDIAPLRGKTGPKPKLAEHTDQLLKLVEEQPDATLEELRERLGVSVCLTTVWSWWLSGLPVFLAAHRYIFLNNFSKRIRGTGAAGDSGFKAAAMIPTPRVAYCHGKSRRLAATSSPESSLE